MHIYLNGPLSWFFSRWNSWSKMWLKFL